MLGNLIGGFVTIMVAIVLAPIVANTVVNAQYPNGNTSAGYNITGASSTILGLTTLFFVLAVATVGISVALAGIKQAGII